MERDPGFYWVRMVGETEPVVAQWYEWTEYERRDNAPNHRWWNIPGSDELFEDEDLVVLSDRISPPT